MERFPVIIVLGAALIGWVGGETIASDAALRSVVMDYPWLHYAGAALGATMVIGLGRKFGKRRAM
jgi:predicted tellurium resistance membrane protein TerC